MTSVCHARNNIINLIEKTAIKHGVCPKLAVAIAKTESGLNPYVIGDLGEIGLFQLRPEFHDVKLGNIRYNIEIAIRYLKYIESRCQSKYGEAWFICYNTGPNRSNLVQYPLEFPYYKKVISHMGRL